MNSAENDIHYYIDDTDTIFADINGKIHIYNYVKTPRIQIPLNNLLISISSDIASIKSLKLSKQEEDKRISKYIQDLKANQEKIYQDYYDRMDYFIKNGHKQARKGTR